MPHKILKHKITDNMVRKMTGLNTKKFSERVHCLTFIIGGTKRKP